MLRSHYWPEAFASDIHRLPQALLATASQHNSVPRGRLVLAFRPSTERSVLPRSLSSAPVEPLHNSDGTHPGSRTATAGLAANAEQEFLNVTARTAVRPIRQNRNRFVLMVPLRQICRQTQKSLRCEVSGPKRQSLSPAFSGSDGTRIRSDSQVGRNRKESATRLAAEDQAHGRIRIRPVSTAASMITASSLKGI